MKLNDQHIEEARKVYNLYWDSYVIGDVDTFATTLDNHFEMIGTSESEICHSKADGIEFVKSQKEELMGKVEMRNRQIEEIPLDGQVLVNELCDIYILSESDSNLILSESDSNLDSGSDWTFYSKIRISTFLRETIEGWKVLQQHGSLPDMRIEEGETLAIDKVNRENIELHDAIKRRTTELENKNRELEIEAALEKIRSASLAMHKTDDLRDVVTVLFEQMQELSVDMGFASVSIFIFEEGSRDFVQWLPLPDDVVSLHVPYIDHPISSDLFDAKESGIDYFEKVYTVEEKNAWAEKGFELTDYKDLPGEFKTSLLEAPGYAMSISLGKHSGICIPSFEGKLPSVENVEILKRVGKVFDQAYIRFLDLQKAEEQAREAHIETALERVRSRSMAMHHTSELQQVIHTVHEELLGLGIGNNGGSFIALNQEIRCWGAGGTADTSDEVRIPAYDKPFYINLLIRLKGKPGFFTEEFNNEQKKEFFKFLFEHEPWSQLSDKEKKEVLSAPGGYTRSCCVGKHVSIFIINHFGKRFSNEENEILKRFTKVFEQVYTRFLDLKRAEEQAREAQIEAALERVRSRTMAMQQSDELIETSELMFDQIKNLGVELWSCGFSLWFDDDSYFIGYNTGPDGKMGDPLKIPLTEDVFFKTIREAKRRGDDFLVFESEGESLAQTYSYMDKLPVVGEFMRAIVEAGAELPKYQVTHCGYFTHGHLMFISLNQNPEAVDIFKRFTKVFEQTYTRFLDLKKAEAQAREAQIELSLERIRAQVTAMQESSDLLDIVVTMRTEFVNLGHEAHYFWHMRWLPEHYKKAMTSGDGSRIGMVMTLPRHIHGDIESVAKWEKSEDPTHVLAMDVDTAVVYIDKMISLGDFEQLDPQAPTLDDIRHIGGLTFIMARTTHGEIGFSLPGVVPDPPEEAVETLVRFAGVFDLAYKRFEDLKESEKRARLILEERDRLEMALNELHATQDQLVQQEKLASLGQLTAGIAHEIKNPLNFVNNFSELSVELVEEAREEVRRVTEDGRPESEKASTFAKALEDGERETPLSRGDGIAEGDGRGVSDGAENTDQPQNFDADLHSSNTPLSSEAPAQAGLNPLSRGDLILEILDDIEANLKTIHKHGSRADAIVKSMLQHSRGGDGKIEPTPLNPLIKEYVNLAFHGMRAGNDPIDVNIDMQLDESIGEIPLIAEDFSRVILNLTNNAFDAMREKLANKDLTGFQNLSGLDDYQPKLTVRTSQNANTVMVEIEDNGSGIPDEMKDRIMQPFFTTKKGTEGTGLGLSISNDIVKAHGGRLEITSLSGEKTTFTIHLIKKV